MKKSTAIIILIIGILIISMCNFDEVKEAFELNIITTTIQSKLINKDNKYIKADLKIPQLTMGNKSIENNLNKKFETDIMSFYNNSYKEAQSFFDDFPEAENKFIVSSDYEVKKSNDDILSILIKYYKYSGGAHGIYEYVPYNIDLTSGNTFVLNDIFTQNSNYEQVINDEIKSQIKTLNKEQGLPEDSTQLYALNKIKNNQKFYIKDDSIVIFFDLYEIAPYVAGVPEFIIKKELINTLLIPKYKEIIFYSSKATTV